MNDTSRPKPDFTMSINVPVNVPSEEEVSYFRGKLDPFLQKLIDCDYLSEEEAAAYINFASEFSMFVPFILDSFLSSYRNSKRLQQEQQQEEG